MCISIVCTRSSRPTLINPWLFGRNSFPRLANRGSFVRSAYRRPRATAHDPSAPSGSVEIMHPYHPLRGKRFPFLKSRCVRGVDCLILQGSESGTFSVPIDWTDRMRPNAYLDANVAPNFTDSNFDFNPIREDRITRGVANQGKIGTNEEGKKAKSPHGGSWPSCRCG